MRTWALDLLTHSVLLAHDHVHALEACGFGVTELTAKLSSLVRDGQLGRDEALSRMEQHSRYLAEKDLLSVG